jgi:hypothetical protein
VCLQCPRCRTCRFFSESKHRNFWWSYSRSDYEGAPRYLTIRKERNRYKSWWFHQSSDRKDHLHCRHMKHQFSMLFPRWKAHSQGYPVSSGRTHQLLVISYLFWQVFGDRLVGSIRSYSRYTQGSCLDLQRKDFKLKGQGQIILLLWLIQQWKLGESIRYL